MFKKRVALLLLIPQLLLSGVFVLGILQGLIQSVGVMPSLGLYEPTLKYYRAIFAREDFASSLFFSVHIAFVSSLIAVVLGTLIAALMVSRKKTAGSSLRLVQIPLVVPHVVVALFVINIFSQNGIIARVFYQMGFLTEQSQFPLLVFDKNGLGILVAYGWKEIPFIIYMVLAVMANVDESLGEAATNLGAGRWNKFFRITLPLCLPTITSGFLVIFAFALGAYELPYLLGSTLPKALPVLSYMQYIHPDLHNRPYAMAMNGVIVGISLLFGALYFVLLKRQMGALGESRENR